MFRERLTRVIEQINPIQEEEEEKEEEMVDINTEEIKEKTRIETLKKWEIFWMMR